MTTYEALGAFEDTLKAHLQSAGQACKVVQAPLAIREPGLIVRLLPRKPFPLSRTDGERSKATRALAVAVLLTSRIESDRAMQTYLAAADALIDASIAIDRLIVSGSPVASSRIVWATSQEDAVFDDPADDAVVWARDEWRVTIYIP